MSDVKKVYADGDVSLSATTRAHLTQDLERVYANKKNLSEMVKRVFGEDTILELNWTTLTTAINSLVNICVTQKKISDVVQEVGDHLYFRTTCTLLLGEGVIVPYSEAPRGKYKDSDAAPQLLEPAHASNLTTIVGALVQGFGTKANLMSFVDETFPDAAAKIDWSTTATAAKSLVTYCLRNKKFGLLLETATTKTNSKDLESYTAFIFMIGAIENR